MFDHYSTIYNKLQMILAIRDEKLIVMNRTQSDICEQCTELGLSYQAFLNLRMRELDAETVKRLTEELKRYRVTKLSKL